MGIIDVLVFGCGVYILYHTYLMKRNHIIPEGVMINKGVTVPKDADVEGFIAAMAWRGVLVGLCACISGICGLISTRIESFGMVTSVISIVFFVGLVLFMVGLKKAHKEYLHLK